MSNFNEELKTYFEVTPRKIILEQWEKTRDFDNVGPTMVEFLNNKMELQIKHLTPYLPYGLELQYIVRGVVLKTGVMTNIIHNPSETHPTKISIGWDDAEHIWMFKPILRPLSELKFDNYHFDFDFSEGFMVKRINETYTRFNEFDYLFQNHYDVFGLIHEGLAVVKK